MPTKKVNLKAINARIERANAAFAKLSPEQQRVKIAKDVLKQLGSGRLKALNGQYFVSKDLAKLDRKDKLNQDDELATVFAQLKQCNVCAIGAAFVCAVGQADKLKVRDVGCNFYRGEIGDDDMRRYLDAFFTEEQLCLIETAFEGWNASYTDVSSELELQAQDFNKGVRSSKARLTNVMKNIVRNNGTFVPADRKDHRR